MGFWYSRPAVFSCGTGSLVPRSFIFHSFLVLVSLKAVLAFENDSQGEFFEVPVSDEDRFYVLLFFIRLYRRCAHDVSNLL